ncbi:MAG: transcriptional regulator [Thaumarchaeota archaeon]|nr:transcriptional regulator [Candidatus Terraquivivens yellowstonensis]MCL7392276.1 transcriptional regulator [Candidatus Terraquivivens yellowstonensis]MCL7397511.1 transcriptional regulator [Candidatus Terraquivivens yellowstonensis]MCL7399470.1 transcriptional regulator [Candidatus Terraquivivens yellowstonensis]MCL7400377.1 transcriptional regulator [Candidatus Terraquivivens yellowstonensis]
MPAIRGLVALELRKSGLSQSRIATLLGITQAAVSLYLSKDPDYYKKKLQSIGIPLDEADKLVKLVSNDMLESVGKANETFCAFWKGMLSRGLLCDYHKSLYPSLGECDVCLKAPEHPSVEHMEILRDMEHALSMLEESSYFVKLIPEVAVNIAMSLKDAKSEMDVAAVPGRIVALRGRPKSMSRPEFGASKHMAKVLLRVRSVKNEVRAVMNMKYDEGVEAAVKKLGMNLAYTEKGDASGEEAVIEAIAAAFRKYNDLDVVFDKGGVGLEPMTYIFGKSATDVVRKALRIARGYIG